MQVDRFTLSGVRFGRYSRGKVHIGWRPDGPPNEVIISQASEIPPALCGHDEPGLSTVRYSVGVLRDVGWIDGHRLCKRCLSRAPQTFLSALDA